MKAISTLAVMAFLCLTLIPAFAAVPLPAGVVKTSAYKKVRVKVKLPHTTDYCYVQVYYQDEGSTIKNGAYGDLVNTYVQLQDINGNTVTALTNITFTLNVTIGSPGDRTITPLVYGIPLGSFDSNPIYNVFVQRTINIADFSSFSASPIANGADIISMTGSLDAY